MHRILTSCAAVLALAAIVPAAASGGGWVQDGLGAYATAPAAGGLFERADPSPPRAPWRTAAMLRQAAPTNQWYSSLMFERWSYPLYALPVSYRATPAGLELGVPRQTMHSAPDGWREVVWPHRAQITVEPTAFKPKSARLAGRGDWNVDLKLGDGAHALRATLVRGSPFSYYRVDTGGVRLSLAAAASGVHASRDGTTQDFAVEGQQYAVFAPDGARWQWNSPRQLVLQLPPGKGFFSIAALPDASAATLALFQAHAFAFVTDTRVHWAYDQATSQVHTRYSARTQSMQDGQRVALLGLLPNLWWQQHIAGLLDTGFASVRGRIKLLAADDFSTTLTYHGFVPQWPTLPAADGGARTDTLLGGDVAKMHFAFGVQGNGTYWMGKGLGRAAQLLAIASAQHRGGDAQALQRMLEAHMQQFFAGHNHFNYFVVDHTIGTTVGFPSEYGSVSHMNDHHFHYGYWITAAAQIALHDPQWARRSHWGGMVDLLVRDIATPKRGSADDPFLRNFDVYEGHSWASGDAMMDAGNNQESSSEAVNAWAGLILWGAATGDTAMRDLGIYLYTTEVHSIDLYWFDLPHIVFAPGYRRVLAAQVFGDKYAYNTWWTQNPREVQGINLLPITDASTYLGRDPAYIARFFKAMHAMSRRYAKAGMSDGTPADIWQDVFAEYMALDNPQQALAAWNSQGSTEAGDSRTHAYYWIRSLQRMGRPDFGVTADTPLYAVFRLPSGRTTHLAYDAGAQPLTVHFSDGAELHVAPHALASDIQP